MLAPDELKSIHPLGLSPVITDGDLVLAESGAIVEYLITKYGGGRFIPSESGYIDNLYYTHYAEGTLAPLLVSRVIYSAIPDRSPLLIRPIVRVVFNALLAQMVDPRLRAHTKMIEVHLGKQPGGFFAGGDAPTSADFMMSFSLETMIARIPVELGKSIMVYVERVRATSIQAGAREGW
ncbi:hypothetical protein FRC07_007687 [Ceratobasidium sp. 392]|nr:hypothetical protein FRC07_007687 [Ceratobasidium sp. 392]